MFQLFFFFKCIYIYLTNAIFWLTRLLNKKESEDQAHVYVPAARKPKLEESPRFLGHRETNINESSDVESVKVVATNPQESMDIEPNTNVAEESKPIKMSTDPKNFDIDPKALDGKIKPTLTNEDLDNFKKSISYVSKIPINF